MKVQQIHRLLNLGFLTRPAKLLGAALAAVALAAGLTSAGRAPSRPVPVLVVGDSVITQTATALVDFAPPDTRVTVAAALGSAPCDWRSGFMDPYAHAHRSFRAALARARPRYVVLMFSGNPGLSGPRGGCVDATRPYSLAQLAETYRRDLTAMALEASRAGATVYFERPPPRNPRLPVGFDPRSGTNAGYNGTPQIASLIQAIATSAPTGDHWRYADLGAALLSGPGFTYKAGTPCTFLDDDRCTRDEVMVRGGPSDAVHLDATGCGAILFALGIEAQLPDPAGHEYGKAFLRQSRARYPRCR